MPELVMNPPEATLYLEQVRAVGAGFSKLEYGAQRRCALALGLTPSMVSWILTGRYLDPEALERLEAWVLGELTDADTSNRWARKGREDHPHPAGGSGVVPPVGGGLDSEAAGVGSS